MYSVELRTNSATTPEVACQVDKTHGQQSDTPSTMTSAAGDLSSRHASKKHARQGRAADSEVTSTAAATPPAKCKAKECKQQSDDLGAAAAPATALQTKPAAGKTCG